MLQGRSQRDATRICPSCRRRFDESVQLCTYCGDTTTQRGYCPVCERPLNLPVGASCPKHEIPLIALDEVDVGFSEWASDSRWAWIEGFRSLDELQAARTCLEAEGIPTILRDERVIEQIGLGMNTGRLALVVAEDHLDRARFLIQEAWDRIGTRTDPETSTRESHAATGPDSPRSAREHLSGCLSALIFGLLAIAAVLGWVASQR